MNYLKIDDCDLNNGIGARVTLWVSGCDLHCKGCHNSIAWDFNKGNKFTEESLQLLFNLLKDDYIKGLSILGGEPLHKSNIDTVMNICSKVKEKYPNKDIWIWTGYTVDSLEKLPNVDYIIDGKFDINRPTNKKWRGSDNQRLFSVNNGNLQFID